MHESVVLKKLRANEPVWCAKANLTDPCVIELMGYTGVQCVWICMEHGPNTFETVAHQVRAAKMLGMDAMVRVAKGCYSDYIRPFEMDATGIMVPHCMSGDEAREIVQMTKFQPLGRRAIDSGNADGPYCLRPLPEYTAWCNRERFVIAQVEDREAVDCMEDIIAVDGIDAFFLGPGDLSHSYGIPGETTHPLITEAIDKMAALCAKYNRPWGLPCGPALARQMLDKGARFLANGADVIAIAEHLRALRAGYEEAGLQFNAAF